MNYTKPENVTSPKDYVDNVRVLFDGGENSISVAKLKWKGNEQIAMRWNISMREKLDEGKRKGKQCLGMPVSTGHPVWFIVPEGLFNPKSDLFINISKKINK